MKTPWLVLAATGALAAAVAALVLTSGGDAPPSGGGERVALVLTDPGPGWSRGPRGVNGAMDRKAASASTVLAPGALDSLLRDHGFRGGYSRVWVRDGDFVTVVAMQLENADGAQAIVDAVLQKVVRTPGGREFGVPGTANARGFLTPSMRADQKASVFCQGAWLVRRAVAAQVVQCTAAPPGLADLTDLVARESAALDRT